jgi:hypothetical protein
LEKNRLPTKLFGALYFCYQPKDICKMVRQQFTAHNSPHSTHRGTIHRAQFTAHNSPPAQFIVSTIHRAQFTADTIAQFIAALFTAHNSPGIPQKSKNSAR